MFRHLLRPTSTSLTVRLLTHLLRPSFSDTGANSRVHESKVYAAFARYMREAAGKKLFPGFFKLYKINIKNEHKYC